MSVLRFFSAFLATGLLAFPSLQARAAASVKSASAAPATSPVTLSGSAENWTWRCVFTAQGISAPPVMCIAEQRLFVQGPDKKTIPLGAVMLARATNDAVKAPIATRPWRLTVMTPLGLSLKEPATVTIDKSTPVSLSWQSCVEPGCLASMDLTQSQADQIRSGKVGHIAVGKLAGGTLTIDFVLSGAGDAMKAVEERIGSSTAH